jgi:hypothetical protein
MSAATRHHVTWAAPLLAVAGLLGYFTVISRWPTLSDFPWLNLLVLAVAVAGSAYGLAGAWPEGGLPRRAGAVLGLGVSCLCAGLLIYYCFFHSYGLPDPDLAQPAGEPIPELTLPDEHERPIDLADVASGDLVLVFFRGHW